MDLREAFEKYIQSEIPSLSEIREKASQHSKASLFIVIILVTLLLLALQFIPHLQVAQFNITNPKDLADAENSYRATLAQILGGIAVGIGIYYTWRRILIAEDSLKVTQEGQITERFTRAVEQLGNEKIEIRLGGIYALERIADESDKDYWPIMEILTTYIRCNLPAETTEIEEDYDPIVQLFKDRNNGSGAMNFQPYEDKKDKTEVNKLPLDIQAILTVIGRRKYSLSSGEPERLDLGKTNLSRFNLIGVNLEGVNLRESNLRESKLQHANLLGAYLEEANLQGANLIKVNLHEAILNRANLQWATLSDAVVTNANFQKANLKNAFLGTANFEGADFGSDIDFNSLGLGGARVSGAILENAYLHEANLKKTNLTGANLKKAVFKEANLEMATLEYADIEGANFEGANLKGTYNLTIEQLSKVKTIYNAKLDPELEKTLREKYPAVFEKPKDESFVFPDEI